MEKCKLCDHEICPTCKAGCHNIECPDQALALKVCFDALLGRKPRSPEPESKIKATCLSIGCPCHQGGVCERARMVVESEEWKGLDESWGYKFGIDDLEALKSFISAHYIPRSALVEVIEKTKIECLSGAEYFTASVLSDLLTKLKSL